jgi:hypothetical protein
MSKAITDAEIKDKKSQILFPITGSASNEGRSMFAKVVGHDDFKKFVNKSSNQNGRLLQQALDKAKKGQAVELSFAEKMALKKEKEKK